MKTKLYGSSDDIVEIEGAVCDEYGNYDDAKKAIQFSVSDGTSGTIKYNGEWKIDLITKGKKFLEIISSVGDEGTHTGEAENCTCFSDVLILNNGIEWVKVGNETYKN